jgi:hypothetical protein
MNVLPVNKFKTQYRRSTSSMTEPNNRPLTDNQNEHTLNFLRYEIASLKSRLAKKDERISSMDALVNTLMGSDKAKVRGYEDLKEKLGLGKEKRLRSPWNSSQLKLFL